MARAMPATHCIGETSTSRRPTTRRSARCCRRLVDETHVHVHAACPLFSAIGLPMNVSRSPNSNAVSRAELLEQEDVVDRLARRIVVLERELPLREVELGVDRSPPGGRTPPQRRMISAISPSGSPIIAGAVHERRRRLARPPPALVVGLEHVGLELDARPSACTRAPPSRRPPACGAHPGPTPEYGSPWYSTGRRRPPRCGLLPAGSDVGERIVPGVDVGEAGRVDADLDLEDLALIIEQPGADATATCPCSAQTPRQVLAAGRARGDRRRGRAVGRSRSSSGSSFDETTLQLGSGPQLQRQGD